MPLYKQVLGISPSIPLSPMMVLDSPSMFLSPYTTSIRSRRSFTPCHLNMLPPPSVSPIQASIMSNKRTNKHNKNVSMTPEQQLDCSLIRSSTKKSMKQVRSSVRKIETQHNRMLACLTPRQQTLFGDESPIGIECDTPKASRLFTPQLRLRNSTTSRRLLTPDPRCTLVPELASPGSNSEYGPAPSFLEDKFTVISILKDINMKKYINLFLREEIDLSVFLMLTSDDMIELGIEGNDQVILKNAIDYYTRFSDQLETSNF